MTVFPDLGAWGVPLPKHFFSAKTVAPIPPDWTSRGKFYLHTAAAWHASVVFRLEATFRSAWIGGVAARLYDETLGAEVANSVISTTDLTLGRYRSGAMVLVDGNVYRVQLTGSFPLDDFAGFGFAHGMSIVAGV